MNGNIVEGAIYATGTTTNVSTTTSIQTTTSINPNSDMDSITNFTLYYFNESDGTTSIWNFSGTTVPEGSSFTYTFNLTNNVNLPMHLLCTEAYSFYGQSFQLDYNNGHSGIGTTIPPRSTYPLTLWITAPDVAYSGPVAIVIGYNTIPLGNLPITPSGTFACGPPNPTGISATGYGYGSSSYAISTNEIVGYVNLSASSASIIGREGNVLEYLPEINTAGIQDNLVIRVNDTDGSTKAYWLQNVYSLNNVSSVELADFATSFSNFSGPTANLEYTPITGSGTTLEPSSSFPGYYVYGSNGIKNTVFPEQLGFYARIGVQQGSGFTVYTGYKTNLNDAIVWYGQFFVGDPSIQNASFYVSKTPLPNGLGYKYDAELVFTGTASGVYQHYNQMNASLGLFYYNESTNSFQSFPYLYTYGFDTSEDVFNLNVSMQNGYAHVTTGAPYYGLLNNQISTPFPSFLDGN